jgi:glycosyltransferase involved in cell wall biosynthesis
MGFAMIAINARFSVHRSTGMQRYAAEITHRLGANAWLVCPDRPLKGIAGHLWEQTILPLRLGDSLLWSPNNTGPLSVGRQVCTIHDLIPLDHPEWFSPRFAAMNRWLMTSLAKRVRHIIAISRYTSLRIQERMGIDERNITVIHNGVDRAFARFAEVDPTPQLLKYGLCRRRYVLFVGSIEPRKNIRTLLQAWSQVQDRFSRDILLAIVGAKGSESVFAQQQPTVVPDRTRLLGYVPDAALPALYSGALAFLYPSMDEGFGLPVIEAMAAGTPVITSSAGAIPEVAGDAALLVDPLSPAEIAAALTTLIESPGLQQRMRERGVLRARQFDWNSCAIATKRVLEEYA